MRDGNGLVVQFATAPRQFGFRLALSAPDRVAGFVIQNGDIYADAFGPKYDFLKDSWNNPGPRHADASPSTSR